MKYSNYNFLTVINNRYYIVNILNETYLEVNQEEYAKIKNGNIVSNDTMNKLYKLKMVIPMGYDEIIFLKNRYKNEQKEKDLLTITIAPTLRCNFGCAYCYEDKNGKIINVKDQIKIVNFIKKQLELGYKKLNLIWFGGEPLMAYETIKKMSKDIIDICAKLHVDYNAFMTTNGYLLNNEIISKLKDLKIEQLFITLDGTKNIHDTRRYLIGGYPTFDVIVKNLILLKKNNINTIIRMNVDKTNEKNIMELKKYVEEVLHLPMYLGLVRNYTESCIKENRYFDKQEYSRLIDIFNAKENLESYQFPRQLPIYCRACKTGTFVIDPDLNIYKCENDIGRSDKKLATIDNYPYNNELEGVNNKRFYEWNPFSYDKCLACKILPICMGGCPFIGIRDNNPECEIYKYNLDNHLKRLILKKESIKDENIIV